MGDKRTSSGDVIRRPRSDLMVPTTTVNLDADDSWDEDYDDVEIEDLNKKQKSAGAEVGDSLDQTEKENDDEEDEDEELLLAELAKIKRERAEESARLAAERKTAEETIRMENILKGNPLLNASGPSSEFKVKRRWDDDVVFKNCARGEVDHAKRGFINDTLRTEFHKKFMRKYIQ